MGPGVRPPRSNGTPTNGVPRAGPPNICPVPNEVSIKINITGNHQATMLEVAEVVSTFSKKKLVKIQRVNIYITAGRIKLSVNKYEEILHC